MLFLPGFGHSPGRKARESLNGLGIHKGGGGGKTYRAILGGKRTIKCPSETSFGGLRKWDSSGLCPFPLRKRPGRDKGGGKRIISGGGSKTVFGDDC